MSAEEAEIEQAETWKHASIFLLSNVLFLFDKPHGRAKSFQYIIVQWEEKDSGIMIYATIFPDQNKPFVYFVKQLKIAFS